MKNRRLLLLFFLVVILAGCGKKSHPDETQMQQDVQQKKLNSITVDGNIHDLSIDSIEIEKEQVKDDYINSYCIINMSDDDLAVTAYYNLLYNYYDKGGWILDSCSTYQDMEFLPLAGVSESEALEDLQYIYRMDSLEYEFTYINDELDLENNSDILHYEVKSTSDIGVRIEQVDVSYLFADGHWEKDDFTVTDNRTSYNLTGREWVSKYYPNGGDLSLSINFGEMDDKTITLTYNHVSYMKGYTTTETVTLPYVITDGTMCIDPFHYKEKDIMYGEHTLDINLKVNLDRIVFTYGEYDLSVEGSLF